MVELFDITFSAVLVALVAATISGVGVAIGSILNWFELRRKNRVRFAELIISFNKDLNSYETERRTITDFNTIDTWIQLYLNKLEEIPHLNLKKKIPDDVAEFFYSWIKNGYHAMLWLEKNTDADHYKQPTKTWEYITQWCEKRQISKQVDDLPHYIKHYCKLQENETQVKRQTNILDHLKDKEKPRS